MRIREDWTKLMLNSSGQTPTLKCYESNLGLKNSSIWNAISFYSPNNPTLLTFLFQYTMLKCELLVQFENVISFNIFARYFV